MSNPTPQAPQREREMEKIGGYGPDGCTCTITPISACPVHGDDVVRPTPEEVERKRGKAHGTEIDISNGGLFLMIEELRQEIKGLKVDLKETRNELERVQRNTDFRIGPGE